MIDSCALVVVGPAPAQDGRALVLEVSFMFAHMLHTPGHHTDGHTAPGCIMGRRQPA